MRGRILILLACAGAMSACTSVVRGTKQKYPITSQPSAASVVIKQVFATGEKAGKEVRPGTQQVCTTPCFLKIKRGRNITVTVSKAGYKTQQVLVESKVTGSGVGTMTAGNFLLGGGIGAIVDASNGSTRSLYPDHVDAILVPDAAPVMPVAAEAPPAPVEKANDDYLGAPRIRTAPPAEAPPATPPAATTPAATVTPSAG